MSKVSCFLTHSSQCSKALADDTQSMCIAIKLQYKEWPLSKRRATINHDIDLCMASLCRLVL